MRPMHDVEMRVGKRNAGNVNTGGDKCSRLLLRFASVRSLPHLLVSSLRRYRATCWWNRLEVSRKGGVVVRRLFPQAWPPSARSGPAPRMAI